MQEHVERMSTKLITCSKLSQFGQWGNSLMQYFFIRTYAKRHNLNYQVHPWPGQDFFGLKDKPVTVKLTQQIEQYKPTKYEACFGVPIEPKGNEYADHDWLGWGQFHTSYYAPYKADIQAWFSELAEPHRSRLVPAVEHLRSLGDTIVSLHIRRADAGRMIFFLTPVDWYLKWLVENWRQLNNPVLFIATEDLSVVPEFAKYRPVLVENLGITLNPKLYPNDMAYESDVKERLARRLDYFPDWYMLANSDILVASDSTFSITAAMLNPNLKEYHRARLSKRRFEVLDPWNCDVSPREHLKDFPGVPGTELKENPYYGNAQRTTSD